MINNLQVATVYVNDIDTAIKFYSDILGFELSEDWVGDDGDRMAFLLPPGGGTMIGLYSPGADDPRVGSQTGMVFTANDIRTTIDELKQRGVRFTRDLLMHDYGDGDRPDDTGDLEAEFADVDGNRFLLHS